MPDPDSPVASREVSRRDFVRSGVGSGFAAAVQPIVSATEVRTPEAGLVAGEITVPAGDVKLPAYRAMPADARGRPLPVVLVVSEIFGVHEHIADICRRFAREGWLAIAPELFVRHGDPGSYGEVAKLVDEVVSKASNREVLADLDACVAWARGNGGDTTRLGVTGFCWGGRITWMYAAHNPGVKAGVAWYGRLANAHHAGDASPIDVAARVKAPVLGLYGGADTGIPLDTVEKMRAALKAAGNTASEIVVYPDAPHAFFADYRPSYRAKEAADGWGRCVDWLRRHAAG